MSWRGPYGAPLSWATVNLLTALAMSQMFMELSTEIIDMPLLTVFHCYKTNATILFWHML